ncbi:hypothetical protein D3C87_1659110 [compost metagenome]
MRRSSSKFSFVFFLKTARARMAASAINGGTMNVAPSPPKKNGTVIPALNAMLSTLTILPVAIRLTVSCIPPATAPVEFRISVTTTCHDSGTL